jgi:hypothetical protein
MEDVAVFTVTVGFGVVLVRVHFFSSGGSSCPQLGQVLGGSGW